MYSCVSLTIFVFFAQGIKGGIPSGNPSKGSFLSYNGNTSGAVYEAWRISGELSFLFKTKKPTAFLAYQDDGSRKFFDLFLVKGKLRAQVRFNTCTLKELTVHGNFSDFRWHRVRLTRGNEENVTLTVDGCKTEYFSCKYTAVESESWRALYVGNLPANIDLNNLANPGIFYETLGFEFQGCIGHVTQTTPEHNPKPLALLHSEYTNANCQSQCSSGRKCNPIDDVTRKECECPGYGNESLICRRHSAFPKANFSDLAKVSPSLLFPSTSLAFVTKITPTVFPKGHITVKATSSSKISWRSSRTCFLSTTTYVRDTPKVEGQQVDKAVVSHSHSVPGLLNRSQHLVTTHASSLPSTVLFPNAAGVPRGTFGTDNTSAFVGKKNGALRSLGSWVFIRFAMTMSVASSLFNQ